MLDRFLTWLYPQAAPLVLGAYFADQHLSIVALRPDPVRLVGVGRQIDFDDAISNDEIRLTVALAADVAELCQRLRIPEGTPTVVAVEPAADRIQLIEAPSAPDRVAVPLVAIDRAVEVIDRAGLDLLAIDPVPVALARLGRGLGESCLVVHPESRWEVFTGPDFIDGLRRRPDGADNLALRPAGLLAAPDGRPPAPLQTLPGVEVPGELAGVVDVGRDGLAFSAALAGLGHRPQSAIDARPTVPTDGWAVEPVLPVERLEGSLP